VENGGGIRSDEGVPIIGIIVSPAVEVENLPLDVEIDTGGVGGPSAGLAFALDLLEELGRDVDRGQKIAVTGTLELDGTVGEIGGVKQKTIGVRRADIDVFVVPAGDNAAEARRYADGVRIVAVKSFQQALRALATLPRTAQD
jgi:PDZ domain-containing protein